MRERERGYCLSRVLSNLWTEGRIVGKNYLVSRIIVKIERERKERKENRASRWKDFSFTSKRFLRNPFPVSHNFFPRPDA